MLDHVIPKPASVGPYDLHRIVEGLTKGERPQFYDAGDHLIVRSNADLTKDGKQLPEVKLGDISLSPSCAMLCQKQAKTSLFSTRRLAVASRLVAKTCPWI